MRAEVARLTEERDAAIRSLTFAMDEDDAKIKRLTATIAERDGDVARLEGREREAKWLIDPSSLPAFNRKTLREFRHRRDAWLAGRKS